MTKNTAITTIIHIIGLILTVHCVSGVIVDTNYGSLQGNRLFTNYGLQNVVTPVVDEFLGIPYAAPPVGELRWQNPRKPARWSGIRNATEHGPCCPQRIFHRTCELRHQDEDCLYLNVYTPFQKHDPGRKYPVMLFIHGGSYMGGSGNRFNGSALSQYGVVLVTLNYRLFALGFMSSGDETIPGNYGLYDQIMALKWVKENIENFRGNSSAVTIFGNSAGAAAVGLLMMSPQARGLFHQVISHSGVPVCSWSINQNSPGKRKEQITGIARALGCSDDRLSDMVSCMRNVPWNKFVEDSIRKVLHFKSETIFFPVVDGRLIPTNPEDIIWKYPFQKIPYIIGVCSKEYAFLGKEVTNEMKDELIAKYRSEKVMRAVRFEYTDWSNVTGSPISSRALSWDRETFDASEVLSDRHMIIPSLWYARLLKLYGHSKTYLYVFDNKTVYHSADLNYVFGVPFVRQDMDERKSCCHMQLQDQQLSQLMMKMWASFAKDGIPRVQIANKPNVKWTTTNQDSLDYLYISADSTEMKQRFKAGKNAFWNVYVPLLARETTACNKIDERTWGFAAVCVILVLIIIVLSVILARKISAKKNNYPKSQISNQRPLIKTGLYIKPKTCN